MQPCQQPLPPSRSVCSTRRTRRARSSRHGWSSLWLTWSYATGWPSRRSTSSSTSTPTTPCHVSPMPTWSAPALPGLDWAQTTPTSLCTASHVLIVVPQNQYVRSSHDQERRYTHVYESGVVFLGPGFNSHSLGSTLLLYTCTYRIERTDKFNGHQKNEFFILHVTDQTLPQSRFLDDVIISDCVRRSLNATSFAKAPAMLTDVADHSAKTTHRTSSKEAMY